MKDIDLVHFKKIFEATLDETFSEDIVVKIKKDFFCRIFTTNSCRDSL